MGRITEAFKAQQNRPHSLYKLSRKPFAVKLPEELHEQLKGLPEASEKVRRVLMQAWRAGAFN